MNLKLKYFGHLMRRADSFGCHFDFPVSVGARPRCRASSVFQPSVTLSTQETGKAIYLGGRKDRQQNVFSGLSLQQGFGSSEAGPSSLLRGPQFPSKGHVSLCTFPALQTHF